MMNKWKIALITLVIGPVYAEGVKTFPMTGISKIKISNAKGQLIINGGSQEKILRTSVEKIKFDEKCTETRTIKGDTLEIIVGSGNKIFNTAHCEAKVTVDIPANSFLEYNLSSGTGEISAINVVGHFDITSSTGNITLKGDVLKNLDITTATGNITGLFKKCEGRSDVDLISASGDTSLELPASCKIRVSHKSATGELYNELGDSADYQVLITGKSASGSLNIKKLK